MHSTHSKGRHNKRGINRGAELESDDGESMADESDSGDDASVESMGAAQKRHTPFAKNRSSPSAISPVHVLEPGKATVDDVFKTMPSVADLRKVVKLLRSEKRKSPHLTNTAPKKTWMIAPNKSWDSNRRGAFLRWTKHYLGFTIGYIAPGMVFLQISRTKGEGILQLLELSVAALDRCRRTSKSKYKFGSQRPSVRVFG